MEAGMREEVLPHICHCQEEEGLCLERGLPQEQDLCLQRLHGPLRFGAQQCAWQGSREGPQGGKEEQLEKEEEPQLEKEEDT